MLLFHLKSSFCSKAIQTFVLTRKKGLDQKAKSLANFKMSQPGSQTIIMHVCVCVCVCMCVCVCVCVFMLFYSKGFFYLQDVCDIHEGYGSTFLCCKYHSRCFCQVPSSPFLKLSYFTSKDTMIYIDIGHKLAAQQTHK